LFNDGGTAYIDDVEFYAPDVSIIGDLKAETTPRRFSAVVTLMQAGGVIEDVKATSVGQIPHQMRLISPIWSRHVFRRYTTHSEVTRTATA
jgi:hypothetical protein